MDPQLIDRIYECAFVPEHWPRVLGELADVAGARAGFLFVSNDDVHHWTSSTQIGIEALTPLVDSGWIARSERFARFLGARHSGFLRDDDLYTPEEMKTDPFYRDILYPRGLGWAAGVTFPLPTGDRLSVNLEREYARGPVERQAVERLDALRPHLARSGLMAARLQLERARAAGEALARIGLAAVVLGPMGKVLAANSLIEAMSEHVQWRADDRLALKDRRADRSLRDAMAAIGAAGGPGVRSFPVRDGEENRSVMIAHLVPVRLSARHLPSGRRLAGVDAVDGAASAAGGTGPVAVRSHTGRGAGRARPGRRQDRERHRFRRRGLAQHHQGACARGPAKNRLQPPGRCHHPARWNRVGPITRVRLTPFWRNYPRKKLRRLIKSDEAAGAAAP